jgi:hypothetical protein
MSDNVNVSDCQAVPQSYMLNSQGCLGVNVFTQKPATTSFYYHQRTTDVGGLKLFFKYKRLACNAIRDS